jgi:hypothetical protein
VDDDGRSLAVGWQHVCSVTEDRAAQSYFLRRYHLRSSNSRQIPGPAARPHRTALHGAALKGFNSIVELLVANGADVHAADANGRTPIELAMGRYEEDFLRQAAEPHIETVELLEKLTMESTPAGDL